MSQFIESLESRTLVTATITGSKTLRIEVTDNLATNVQVVMIAKNRFTIAIDGGTPTEYTYSRVSNIRFYGGDGNDVFQVTNIYKDVANGIKNHQLFNRRTTLNGGAGDDTLIDGYGSSRINGGDGNDTIIASGGSDLIVGSAGNDFINAGPPPEAASQKDGDDRVFAGSGDDTVLGGGGKDVIFGQAGNDSLTGGSNRDALYGNGGDDFLDGEGDRNIEYAGGQAGDIVDDLHDKDRDSRGELGGMSTYLNRIIRHEVPESWQADAKQ